MHFHSDRQAAQLFRDKKSRSSKKCKKKRGKIKCSSRKETETETEKEKEKRKENGDYPSFDPEAVCCQYYMAEKFVKSILDWKCPIPKEEYHDIAEVILKRLSSILEYTPAESGDRKTQQMRFLADVISCWISGVLLEVAKAHKEELVEEYERKQQEREEDTDEDTDEDEEEIEPKASTVKSDEEESDEDEEESEEDEDVPKEVDDKSVQKDDEDDEEKKPRKQTRIQAEVVEKGTETDMEEVRKEYEVPKGLEGEETKKTIEKGVGEDRIEGAEVDKKIEDQTEPIRIDVEADSKIGNEKETGSKDIENVGVERIEDVENVEQEATVEQIKEGEKIEEKENIERREVEEKIEEGAGKEGEQVAENVDGVDKEAGKEAEKVDKEVEREVVREVEGEVEKDVDGGVEGGVRGRIEEADKIGAEKVDELDVKEVDKIKAGQEADKVDRIEIEEEAQKVTEEQVEKGAEQNVEKDTDKDIDKDTDKDTDKDIDKDTDKEIEKKTEVETVEDGEKEKDVTKLREEMEELPEITSLPTKDTQMPIKIGPEIKVFQSDLPFVTFIKIFNSIYNMIEGEEENFGQDPIINRLHRAVYEKFHNAVNLENPTLLNNNAKDVIDVMAGKIAIWLSKILSQSQVLLMDKYPPKVESFEVRDWSKWLNDTTQMAANWTMWLQTLIEEAQKMKDDKITRGQWQDWTQKLDRNAILWRKFQMDTIHQAHHNAMMIKGREVIKTGEERELNVFDFEL